MHDDAVFDANFFILMDGTGMRGILETLVEAMEELSIRPHTTEAILREIRTVRLTGSHASTLDYIRKHFHVASPGAREIRELERRLGRDSPQGPDLASWSWR